MARLFERTHDQPTTDDGAKVRDGRHNAIPCPIPNQVQVKPYNQRMYIHPSMWNEHQDAVEQLLVQYRILQARQKDMAELADLIENDWLTKLDRLTDFIIDQDDMTSQFSKGLMTAYNIMRGAH